MAFCPGLGVSVGECVCALIWYFLGSGGLWSWYNIRCGGFWVLCCGGLLWLLVWLLCCFLGTCGGLR